MGAARKEWCCQTGLNCRPLHYQWSALPLSYGSMPRIRESAQRASTERADPCHKAPFRASAGAARKASKTTPSGHAAAFSARSVAGRSGSHLFAERLRGLGRADHDLEFDHFAGLVEFDEVDASKLPFADIGAKFQRDIISRSILPAISKHEATGSRCRMMMANAKGSPVHLRKIRAKAQNRIGGRTG
jgi:hypothetical protein